MNINNDNKALCSPQLNIYSLIYYIDQFIRYRYIVIQCNFIIKHIYTKDTNHISMFMRYKRKNWFYIWTIFCVGVYGINMEQDALIFGYDEHGMLNLINLCSISHLYVFIKKTIKHCIFIVPSQCFAKSAFLLQIWNQEITNIIQIIIYTNASIIQI